MEENWSLVPSCGAVRRGVARRGVAGRGGGRSGAQGNLFCAVRKRLAAGSAAMKLGSWLFPPREVAVGCVVHAAVGSTSRGGTSRGGSARLGTRANNTNCDV